MFNGIIDLDWISPTYFSFNIILWIRLIRQLSFGLWQDSISVPPNITGKIVPKRPTLINLPRWKQGAWYLSVLVWSEIHKAASAVFRFSKVELELTLCDSRNLNSRFRKMKEYNSLRNLGRVFYNISYFIVLISYFKVYWTPNLLPPTSDSHLSVLACCKELAIKWQS
jgi:hypothetical protein